MTPQALETLHSVAFTTDRAWRAHEFQSLLESPHTALICAPHGFALTRTLAGETELLTLAVDPAHQRKGIARSLVLRWLDQVAGSAETAFLEVAADNHAARGLYDSIGFQRIATRPAYYKRINAASADALILQYRLTRSQIQDSAGQAPESG